MNGVPSTERSYAALAHASGVFFPILGPLAVFILQNRSRFVRFHALHALIGTLLLDGFLFVLAGISLSVSLVGLYRQYQEGFENFSLWQVLLKSAATWLVLGLIGVANTVLNLVQATRAYRGETPITGLTSTIVRRLLGERATVDALV